MDDEKEVGGYDMLLVHLIVPHGFCEGMTEVEALKKMVETNLHSRIANFYLKQLPDEKTMGIYLQSSSELLAKLWGKKRLLEIE